jgi:hypothetical protein
MWRIPTSSLQQVAEDIRVMFLALFAHLAGLEHAVVQDVAGPVVVTRTRLNILIDI